MSCIDRLAEHVADVEWTEGSAQVERLGALAALAGVATTPAEALAHIEALQGELDAFAGAIVDRWFATPVRPILVRAETRRRWRTRDARCTTASRIARRTSTPSR